MNKRAKSRKNATIAELVKIELGLRFTSTYFIGFQIGSLFGFIFGVNIQT